MQALTFQTARSFAELAQKGEEAQHDFLLGRDTRRVGYSGIHGPLAEDELDGYVQSEFI
jgi:hypothetical protein